jgi:hypothetical protein
MKLINTDNPGEFYTEDGKKFSHKIREVLEPIMEAASKEGALVYEMMAIIDGVAGLTGSGIRMHRLVEAQQNEKDKE